jgi:hypothetical protein
MSQTEPDPSQSTEMFRAFVDRGAGDDRVVTPQRRVPPVAIVGIVAVVVVLAIAAWLVF